MSRPENSNVVGSKWVFRTKYRSDGSIDRHKARIVAQGFTQVLILDYAHTFSPIVKASMVRIILYLAVHQNWSLRQLDVNNAFLNGNMSETVFMEQPPGFVDSRYPNYVCRFNKALYGLKQAPRAWFQRLSTFLTQIGFHYSRADPSLFLFTRDTTILYLLVYIDNIILSGYDKVAIANFITRLNQEFAIKDLGTLSYFWDLRWYTQLMVYFLHKLNMLLRFYLVLVYLMLHLSTHLLQPHRNFCLMVNHFMTPLFTSHLLEQSST